jgi:glycosyltransferase involved in cell wall biosynthesis
MSASSKRILLVLPCAIDANRGNATSAARIGESLSRRGYDIHAAEVDSDSAEWPEFDLAIAFHAEHCGPATKKICAERKKPYVVVFTGTDLNGKPQSATENAVNGASACVALCTSAARRARDIFTEIPSGIDVIFQAVLPLPYKPGSKLPDSAPELQAIQKLVLVPAGVRDIKDPLRAIKALTPLAAIRPELTLWFVGPELEESCGEQLREAIVGISWAHWIGEVPRAELLPLMRRADVILSTSRSEGAAPNSLLEAVLAGTPVLASDIPPHKEFPGGAHCFRDDRLLRRKLEKILDDTTEAAREVRKLQEVVRHKHGLSAEQLAWDRLLGNVLEPDRPRSPAKPMKPRKSELPKKWDRPKNAERSSSPAGNDENKGEDQGRPAPPRKPMSPGASPWDRARKKRED